MQLNNMMKYYKPVEMLRLYLNAHFIPLMSINPLTTAHCDKNEHLQMCPVLTTAIAVSNLEKTDGKSNRAAQDMLHGKINHEQIRTTTPSKIYSTSLWCMGSNALQEHCG